MVVCKIIYLIFRDILHLVILPKFWEVEGNIFLMDQDHTANMVEPKLGL